MRWSAPNPWVRKAVQVTCRDAYDAALDGDKNAILVNDEMRARNRGIIYIMARPGDDIWHLALDAIRTNRDYTALPTGECLYDPGHG